VIKQINAVKNVNAVPYNGSGMSW